MGFRGETSEWMADVSADFEMAWTSTECLFRLGRNWLRHQYVDLHRAIFENDDWLRFVELDLDRTRTKTAFRFPRYLVLPPLTEVCRLCIRAQVPIRQVLKSERKFPSAMFWPDRESIECADRHFLANMGVRGWVRDSKLRDGSSWLVLPLGSFQARGEKTRPETNLISRRVQVDSGERLPSGRDGWACLER